MMMISDGRRRSNATKMLTENHQIPGQSEDEAQSKCSQSGVRHHTVCTLPKSTLTVESVTLNPFASSVFFPSRYNNRSSGGKKTCARAMWTRVSISSITISCGAESGENFLPVASQPTSHSPPAMVGSRKIPAAGKCDGCCWNAVLTLGQTDKSGDIMVWLEGWELVPQVCREGMGVGAWEE